MKLNFQRAGFVFKDEAGDEFQAVYEPCPTPDGKKPGKFYSISIFKNGEPIGALKDDSKVNRENASVFVTWAIHKAH